MPIATLRCGDKTLDLSAPIVMGVLNVTPDSFSDGGRFLAMEAAVEQALRIVNEVKPKRAFFTHICHDLPHAATDGSLPPGVRLAYDGMKLEFEI